MKKKILVLNGQYLPGYKGGGPIQSSVNMIENLAEEYDFSVLCADRDYKETEPYRDVVIDGWNKVGSARVFYMSPKLQSFSGFRRMLNETDYDILYLNGYFSPIFTIKPLLIRLFGRLKNKSAKIVLASRGDFSGGCENKKLKKYTYIYLSRLIGLYKDIVWHASTELEKKDILEKFSKAKVMIAENLPAKYQEKESYLLKEKGKLRLAFVSRIFPKKNLKYALEVLKEIKEGEIIFDIYGPMEDVSYWRECQSVIDEMPSNVKVEYKGEVEHSKIAEIFSSYHAFFFPTLGENYGHVIVEAMMNHCLCILSRGTTPWDGYIDEINLGAELDNKKEFVNDIENLISMNQEEMGCYQKRLSEYVLKRIQRNDVLCQYRKLFE